MSDIGEAQITKLTRERLAAIKKFLPVRDTFRDNLQQQQQIRTDFTAGTERLFTPITTATKQVGSEIAKVAADTTNIARHARKTEEILKDLPVDIVVEKQRQPLIQKRLQLTGQLMELEDIITKYPEYPSPEREEQFEKVKELRRQLLRSGLTHSPEPLQQIEQQIQELRSEVLEQPSSVEETTPKSSTKKTPRKLDPEKIFKPTVIKEIRKKEYDDDEHFAQQLIYSYDKRNEFLNPGYEGVLDDKETFVKKMYLARVGKTTVRKDPKFDKFFQLIKEKSEKAPSYLVSQVSSSPIVKTREEEEEFTDVPEIMGSGYNHIPCSRSILDDISRLEVLIGGLRAGNNSPEIINEATEICQRLFRGRIMDIQSYRKLVDELIDKVDGYHSD